MASAMNKEEHDEDLSSEYEKQRLSFIADLRRFNENRGTPFDRIPEIGGREVDLYHLYQRVTGLGGRHKVNNEQLWEDFQEEFQLPRGCVNSAQALKNVYFRYLNLYEKVNFLGEDPDLKNNEEEEGPARKKICLPIETIPLYYNYNQHKLTDAMRQQHSLSTEIYTQSQYEKLIMSLRSGLPNEVDLAVNVCVLLSTEGKHCIKLEHCPQLLRLLLAHIGVFDEESNDMQDLYQQCWMPYTKRNFLRFWFETVDKADIRSLISWRGQQYVQRELVGSDVLNLGRDLGILDVEGQRVLQIAVFLHNISFEEANQKILASTCIVYKFLMLGLHSTYGGLRQLALDTFANLSCELALDAVEGLSSKLVLDIINNALFSEDRFFLVRGLEILSKMSQLACSENILIEHLKEDVYKRLVDLLTVQDIQLIVHTLEALYKLSKVGEPFTTRIARVHRAIDTLVSLITIEAQSFGPGSLVGIKVVEYVPPAHVSTEDGDSVRRPTTVIQPINPDSVNIYQVPANLQSQLGVVPDTGGGKGPGGGGDVLKAAASEKDPLTDIQPTTTSWLNATYELKKKSKVNQVELFSDYLQFCRKFGISNALSSAEFLHLVKVTFHECEVLSINRKNGDRDVYFEGLCKRSTQKPFAVTTLPLDKVRNPLCVNVSLKPTPCQVVDPLAHTPTLRQRLMEPPRVSLHPQLPHTGASSSSASSLVTSTSTQGASKNSSHQNSLTLVGPGRATAGVHIKVMKNGKIQPGTSVTSKKVFSVVNSSGILIDNLNPSPGVVNHPHVNKAQTSTTILHTLNSGTAQSFPSITHALQTEQLNRLDASDLLSVKSLLAKKLSQAVPEQDSSASPGPSFHSSGIIQSPGATSISTQTSQPHIVVTSANLNSSQAILYQQNRPVSQTVSCVVSSASPLLASSAAMSILSPLKLTQSLTTHEVLNPNPQNSINLVQATQGSSATLNQLGISPSMIQNSLNSVLAQQNTNLNTAIITQHSNIVSSSLQNPVVSFVQRNTNPYMQNAQISVVQQNALHPSGSQTDNISLVLQQQNSTGVHLMQQSCATGTSLSVVPQNSMAIVQQQNLQVQQNTSNIPCAILPKMAGAGQQHGNSVAVSAITPQSSSSLSSSHQSSVTVNHSVRNPSAMIVANHQAGRTSNNSNALTLSGTVQGAANTQSVSSPAVAALLTTSSQSGSQMIISAPVIAGQVQRPQTISGQAPTTVVIQTPPGTIVMPSRQVVVQGNGSTAFGSVQQGSQGGTVSFIVPSQYRQGSSVTVQGLNFIQQQGSVNVVPSLALANSNSQSQTQNIIQAAQSQQNLLQAAQNQPNIIQTGTRQIVLTPSQAKTLPVGVQISSLPGNFVRNTPNLCITPQEQQSQQNIIIQSSSIQSLPQVLSSSAANVTMNISQIQPSVQIPLHPAESQPVRSDLYLHSQQQPQHQIVNQTFNISPLVVMDTQQHQSLLPSQCNGMSHDVNGILGSPESVGSDFPPSPLSTGIVSDKDMPNGKLTDLDKDSVVKKNDIERVTEKTKMNGYVHTIENSTHDDIGSGQSESLNIRAQAQGLSSESQGVIINGCVSGVIQGSNSVGHRMNIPVSQGGNSSIGGGVIQIQASANPLVQQHGIQQQIVNTGQQVTAGVQQKVVGFVQQQQLQFQPQQLQQHLHLHLQQNVPPSQQQQHAQVQIQPQSQQVNQQLQLQRPQLAGATHNQQQQSNIQQQSRNYQQSTLRPRISTLPCQPPGPQAGITTIRPVLIRDFTRDSDISNDSVASMADADKHFVTNGQSTQTIIVTPSTSKNKSKTRKVENTLVSDKLLPKPRSKKKCPTEEAGNTGQALSQDYGLKSIPMEYMCEWASCKRCFSSARLVFLHVFKYHLPKSAESSCQWTACEKLVRKRWSLVSHVQDHHCSESAMRTAFQRRLTSTQQQPSGNAPAPHQPMIYPPDAAMQAIRRFSIKHPYPEFADQREGPVSKHIRLTAALILRNICHFSSLGRRLVRRHEQDLSYNMINAVEASTALSHCLWEIVQCCEQKPNPLKI